jgi:S1-C subfamily serine protease
LGRQLDGPALDLIQAIQESTSGAWYDRDSTGGHLSLFNGLLVVRQTDEVHTQVQKLLDALREAGNAQPGGSVTVPKERKSPSTSTAVPAAESTLSVKPSQTKKRVWFSMGVTTSLVSGPAWVEKSGKVRSQPVGLKIEDLDDDGLAASAGFRVGDIVLSWSADKWSRNSTDNNLIASGGAAYTMPGAAEFDSAAGHGTTAIIFAVTRADESGVQRYRGVTLPLGTEHTRRAVVESLLGLQTVQVNERELKQLGDFQTLKDHSGEIAKVVEVKPGGPAAAAGIRQGDMITAVNIVGASVTTPPSSIAEALSRHARSFKLSLLRPKGESYQTFVALIQGAEGGLKEIGIETERLSAWRILGIKLEPAAGLEGLTISEIRADGPAADAWFLQPGDVLVGLGKWNVHDGEQLKAALENIKEWDAVEVLTVRGDETLMGTMSIKNK